MSLKYLVGPTGGLSYHWIASRRAAREWKPFRAQVDSWLTEWRQSLPKSITELVIFGPSGGYTFSLKSLSSFTKLTFVEPDPVARYLLKRKVDRSAQTKSFDFISDESLLPWFSEEPCQFEKFVEDHPHAAFLFSNLLGQIPLLVSKSHLASQNQAAQDEFLNALQGRAWASYHDLFSCAKAKHAKLSANAIPSFKGFEASTRLSEIAIATFPGSQTLVDHETSWLSVGRRTEFSLWPLTKNQVHLIGFVKQS